MKVAEFLAIILGGSIILSTEILAQEEDEDLVKPKNNENVRPLRLSIFSSRLPSPESIFNIPQTSILTGASNPNKKGPNNQNRI